MRAGGRWLLAAVVLCGCSRPAEKPANGPKSKAAPAGNPPAAPVVAEAAAPAEPKITGEADLKTEELEANPYSESVTLKLSVVTRANALVLWGAKQMAHLEPGKMDAEITRPRGSGPLDLEIKADGYMPYHTRLYADRNDKLSIRLYRIEEAPSIFGYKRSAEGKKAEAEKQK